MKRFFYRHHGFTLSSNEPLGRIPSAVTAAAADIAVHALAPGACYGAELPWVRPDPAVTLWRADSAQGSCLRLRYARDNEWTEFVIDDRGESVWISRGENIVLEEVAELLLGPVFSCMLAQRGFTCLHAATVAVADRAVAIVGRSGAGKSTTALGLVQRGGALIADDVCVLSQEPGSPAVLSGAPRLRMRRDSAISLVGSYAALDPMWIHEDRRPDKRYVNIKESAVVDDDTTWPLAAVYILVPDNDCAKPSLIELPPAQALGRLMAFRHMVGALDATAHRRDFPMVAGVTESVPVCELRRPVDLASAPDVVAAILANLAQLD